MFVEKQNILKKPYLPPRIEFEELEEDGMDKLMGPSVDSGSGGDYEKPDPENSDEDPDALDLNFSMDFVVNDEPQL